GSLPGKSAQKACPISPSVDSDAVGALVNTFADRVTMNDDHSVVVLAVKEVGADPAKIDLALQRTRQPGADSRMDEQIVAEAKRVGKAGQELAMFVRDRITDNRQRVFLPETDQRRGVGSVTPQTLG